MFSIVFSPAAGGTIQPQRKFNVAYKFRVDYWLTAEQEVLYWFVKLL